MLCCVCKEKTATVHLTQITGDKMQKVDLCEDCAKSWHTPTPVASTSSTGAFLVVPSGSRGARPPPFLVGRHTVVGWSAVVKESELQGRGLRLGAIHVSQGSGKIVTCDGSPTRPTTVRRRSKLTSKPGV